MTRDEYVCHNWRIGPILVLETYYGDGAATFSLGDHRRWLGLHVSSGGVFVLLGVLEFRCW